MSCGFFATAVLNINNIRDIESDTKAGKKTIPARLGKETAIKYHWFLLTCGMLCAILYIIQNPNNSYAWVVLLSFPLFFLNGIYVAFLLFPDPMLKQMALSTLFFVILFGVGQLI